MQWYVWLLLLLPTAIVVAYILLVRRSMIHYWTERDRQTRISRSVA